MPKAGVSMLRWLWLAPLVIVLDQLTKYWADSKLHVYWPKEIMPGLNLTLSYNTGAAFSFLAGAGGWQRWFFVALALGVASFIIIWVRRLKHEERWMAIALALILGGAIGNVIDRVFIGHVIDFIDVYFHGWHWPAFNIADSAITIGAVMMVVDSLRGRRSKAEH